MKLLYFLPLLSTTGGQERTLTDKANYLVGEGHQVMFVTYEHEGPVAYPLDGRVLHTDLGCHFFRLYRYPTWQRFTKALRLKHLFRKKFRQEVETFKPDVIVVAIPNTENFICDVLAVAGKVPVVIESHLAYGRQVIRRGFTEKWLYWLFPPMRAVRRARLLVALTKGDASCWRKENIKDIKVIHNPVTCYPSQIASRADSMPQRIIAVGRLTSQKRFDRLIDAFALVSISHPGWHLDIIGQGEDKVSLQQQIEKLRLSDCIHLLPPTTDIYAEYQRSQFFVLSSDYEGFGLVIIEAMACGIPVVSTDCPFGPSEIISDGETGLLVKMDVEDLARKMEWMITHEAERLQMGIKARQAAADYRKEVVMPKWVEAYMSAISSSSAKEQ